MRPGLQTLAELLLQVQVLPGALWMRVAGQRLCWRSAGRAAPAPGVLHGHRCRLAFPHDADNTWGIPAGHQHLLAVLRQRNKFEAVLETI